MDGVVIAGGDGGQKGFAGVVIGGEDGSGWRGGGSVGHGRLKVPCGCVILMECKGVVAVAAGEEKDACEERGECRVTARF